MNHRKALAALTLVALGGGAVHAAVTVEIAAEAGPQATAQQPWLQRLSEAGAVGVRARQARDRERPKVEEFGTADRPRPKLTAVLTRKGELLAPGARFRINDRKKLRDYLERLAAEGAEASTAPRGTFDLTEAQFTEVFDALSPRLGSFSEEQTIGGVVDACRSRLAIRIEADRSVERTLRANAEGVGELSRLSIGTALAILLRQEGLALLAEKPVGQPVKLSVVSSRGREETWPIGYEPEGSPRETAPALFEWVNAEIDGFSLAQALDAIGPRVSSDERPLPILLDRYTLRRETIDPAKVAVQHAPKRTFYKKVIDRIAFQARLDVELRVDEAGRPFLWLTR